MRSVCRPERSSRADLGHETWGYLRESLIAHPAASGHVVVSKINRLERHFVSHPLVPERARRRSRNELFDDGPPVALENVQQPSHIVASLPESAVQRNRVVEREARPRANRE